jgi:hypothetical protein
MGFTPRLTTLLSRVTCLLAGSTVNGKLRSKSGRGRGSVQDVGVLAALAALGDAACVRGGTQTPLPVPTLTRRWTLPHPLVISN